VIIPAARAPSSEIQAEGATNCTFGGDDGKTLYITAWTTVWKVEGMPLPDLDFVNNTACLQC
jgi:hypothetical protein